MRRVKLSIRLGLDNQTATDDVTRKRFYWHSSGDDAYSTELKSIFAIFIT